MDNRYEQNIIEEMQPFLEEQAFRRAEDGSFVNETRAIKIAYEEARQMYTLSVAEVQDGSVDAFSEINAWLFDDSQTARDAAAVGVDFVASLRKNMNIKRKRAAGEDIDLPAATKTGAMTVTGFTKKALDVFPALKDLYKAHVAENGNFLALHFFGRELAPRVKKVLAEGGKKQMKKLFDVFDDVYVRGDKETVNLLLAVLCAAAYGDEQTAAAIRAMLADDSHFKMSFENLYPAFCKNKKLVGIMIQK